MSACPLCQPHAENILWRDDRCRIIDVADSAYPGYSRVIWNSHVREMTDLAQPDREHVMQVVWVVEQALRTLSKPEKINLAAFGNQVPHLHWHIIPRFSDDPHFPDPIWAVRRRDGAARSLDRVALIAELARRLP